MRTNTSQLLLLTLLAVSYQSPLKVRRHAQKTEEHDSLSGPAREVQEEVYDNLTELSFQEDVNGISEYFTEDCRLLYNQLDVLIGRESMIELQRYLIDELEVKGVNYYVKEVGPIGSNYTFVWGVYEAYIDSMPDRVAEYGKFFDVLKMVDGRWYIYISTTNPSPYKHKSCTDDEGNEYEHGETWSPDNCTECSCEDGDAMCSVPMCVPPSHGEPICNMTDDSGCCPIYECKSGCVGDDKVFHDPGQTWSPDECTQCECPAEAKGLMPHECFLPDCPPPPSDSCVTREEEGECCPTYDCQPEAEGPCNPNPCMNGGECSVKFTFYYGCSCPEGFEGTQCEVEVPTVIPTKDCPTACIFLYAPVCGTDGTTYSNECEMTVAACEQNIEITVAYQGECEIVCMVDGVEYKNGDNVRPKDSCVDCMCSNGEVICPIVDCFFPEDPLCVSKGTPEGECCPVYDCPEKTETIAGPTEVEVEPTFPVIGKCTYFCASDYTPVCGSDGKTHSNECEMGRAACQQDIEITMVSQGECKTACPEFCTSVYDPVCGSDGSTYSNQCEMDKKACLGGVDITVVSNGACDEPAVPLSVCTVDGVEYKDGESVKPKDSCVTCVCILGEVSCPMVACLQPQNPLCVSKGTPEGECCPEYECPELEETTTKFEILEEEMTPVPEIQEECTYFCASDYTPVCGSDGNTHSNECEMGRAACQQDIEITVVSQGECPPEPSKLDIEPGLTTTVPVIEKTSEPEVEATFPVIGKCTYFCTSDYTPVCGSDGNTHSNECEMGRAACQQDIEITMVSQGECSKEPSKLDIESEPTTTVPVIEKTSEPEVEATFPVIGKCTYFCTSDYTPVCGSDGNTHSNECEMGRAACQQDIEITMVSQGECSKEPSKLDIEPELTTTVPVVEKCIQLCTLEDAPVCGSDNNTYPNECEMEKTACEENTEITVAYPGECGPGCTDRFDNPKTEGEKWDEPCGECTCVNGNAICPIALCSGPPNPLCTVNNDPDECCPSFNCPEGCFDENDIFYETGQEWMSDTCTMCICPAGEGLRPAMCKTKACDLPPSELCVSLPLVDGECCPAFDCSEGEQALTTPELTDEIQPVPTEPPFFTKDLVDGWVVRYSQPVTLTCGATDVDPQAISYECNGQIMETSRITYTDETVGGAQLQLASIDISRDEVEAHTGEDKFWCQCVASTEDFTIYRSSKAYVGISFFRKKYGKEPVSTTANAGATVLLECIPPMGRPDPEITWEKNGTLLTTGEGSNFSITEEGTLAIESVSVGDEGTYVCVATNPAKTRKSKPATVTVTA